MFEQNMPAEPGQTNSELRSALASATPGMLQFGGERRVLAVLPRDAAGKVSIDAMTTAFGVQVTAVHGADNNFAICVESSEMSLPHIAATFVEYRRDRVEFASRVHSRTDVAWTPLLEMSMPPEPAAWPEVKSCPTVSRDEMRKTLVI
jgi:hypothetical protein